MCWKKLWFFFTWLMSKTLPWFITVGEMIVLGSVLVGLVQYGVCIIIACMDSETGSNRWTGFVIKRGGIVTFKCKIHSWTLTELQHLKSDGLIQLCHATCSQMSNLMNQARLKVLKARDDLIAVSISVVKTQRFYSYHLLGNDLIHILNENMICDWVIFASTYFR